MRIKLHTTFACCSALLLLMSGTGHGITIHDDAAEVLVKTTSDSSAASGPEKTLPKAEGRDNINSEKPNSLLTDSVEFDLDRERVVLEPARPGTAAGTTVSKWLEARANEHNVSATHSHKGDSSREEAAFLPDMMVGGGWCDMCGCWMRHGCDPNGNCSIGHLDVCGTGYCSLHPYNACSNTG